MHGDITACMLGHDGILCLECVWKAPEQGGYKSVSFQNQTDLNFLHLYNTPHQYNAQFCVVYSKLKE